MPQTQMRLVMSVRSRSRCVRPSLAGRPDFSGRSRETAASCGWRSKASAPLPVSISVNSPNSSSPSTSAKAGQWLHAAPPSRGPNALAPRSIRGRFSHCNARSARSCAGVVLSRPAG
jgi:hypothetical protein